MLYPRLVIAGTQSGVGKTTLSLALMAALSRRGLSVRPFKVGPDYIDPSLHHRATGNRCTNLDAWLVSETRLHALFRRRASLHAPYPGKTGSPGADDTSNGRLTASKACLRPFGGKDLLQSLQSIASVKCSCGLSLIEGVMGLYDGHACTTWASTAHVASLLQSPVLLVVNAEGMSLSAAALISGYADFASKCSRVSGQEPDLSGLRVAGILLNRVSSERHYAVLKDCIESNTGIPCLGHAPKGAVPVLPERHLGLVPAGELEELEDVLERLADLAEHSFDLEAIIRIAGSAPPLPPPGQDSLLQLQTFPGLRIGIARDVAFSFHYQENLEMLEAMGAKLVFFSPLKDNALPPNLDGIYLGGGFPELFANALESNASFRTGLAEALEDGLPAYAECGGMLYLCSSLSCRPPKEWHPEQGNKRSFTMTGFFPEGATMTERLQPFGYVTVTLLKDCVLGTKGTRFHAHEFHYACLEEEHSDPLFLIEKADGRSWKGGLSKKNVAAGFPHLHFYGCPEIAASFLAACQRRKASTEYAQ